MNENERTRYFVYKMTTDSGAAPCVQGKLLSLAICKPQIRKSAKEGHIVFGFVANTLHADNRLIYVAKVTEVIANGGYYRDARFRGRAESGSTLRNRITSSASVLARVPTVWLVVKCANSQRSGSEQWPAEALRRARRFTVAHEAWAHANREFPINLPKIRNSGRCASCWAATGLDPDYYIAIAPTPHFAESYAVDRVTMSSSGRTSMRRRTATERLESWWPLFRLWSRPAAEPRMQ